MINWERVTRKIVKEKDMEDFLLEEGMKNEIMPCGELDSCAVIDLAIDNSFLPVIAGSPGGVFFIKKEDAPNIIIDKERFAVYYQGDEEEVLFGSLEETMSFEKAFNWIFYDKK